MFFHHPEICLCLPPSLADVNTAAAASEQMLRNVRPQSVVPHQAEAVYQGQEGPWPPAGAQVGASIRVVVRAEDLSLVMMGNMTVERGLHCLFAAVAPCW